MAGIKNQSLKKSLTEQAYNRVVKVVDSTLNDIVNQYQE